MKAIVAALILVCGVLGGAFLYFMQSYYKTPKGHGETTIVFDLVAGEAFNTVTRQLEERGVLGHASWMNMVGRFYGLRGKLRAGEYALNDGLSPEKIFEILSSGKSLLHSITVTEGLNSYEVAILVEKKGFGSKQEFLKVCSDPSFLKELVGEGVGSCEGYLYPETYNFDKNANIKLIIQSMVKMFLKVYEQVAQGRQIQAWGRHQVLTFASLIEKETGAPEERSLIASVFYNRLQKKMRLQTDPTVQYGILKATGSYPMNITKKDLVTPTAYNTYTIEGLPPGPISNPGKESLRAVFEPANTDYFFFVSKNDGTHIFTKNYEDHQNAVRNFQLNSNARVGKSWRELSEGKSK